VNWCCKCEKCAFVFLLLSAWLPPLEGEHLNTHVHIVLARKTSYDFVWLLVCAIFGGKNLLNDVALQEIFLGLVGGCGTKSFECVGTFKEAQEAALLTAETYQSHHTVAMLPIVLDHIIRFIKNETT
jgi:hypothetical protein